MRRIRFTGRPERITVARPAPGPGQLLVEVELAGVGIGLVRMLREGNAADPGGEIAGTVVEAAPELAEWVGRRVAGVVFAGAHAEFALAVPGLVTEVPAGVAAADALAVVRGGLVALGALRAGRVATGEAVLIIGAASGSGHLAVQLAGVLGAGRVIAAVSSSEKAEFLRKCGADAVISYGDEWIDTIDVVLDGVGGELAQRGVDALRPHGRLVAFSAGGGAVETGSLLAELKTVTGFSVGLLSRTRPELIESYRRELWELLTAGKLRPRATVLPADRIAEAIGLVESRRNLGRVMVDFGGGRSGTETG